MKTIKLGVKGKMTAVFVAMGLLLSLSVGYAVYSISYRQVEERYTELALSAARAASALVNGDSVEGYLQNGADGEYEAAYALLTELKGVFGLSYLYVVRPDTEVNNCVYIFDILSEGGDAALIAGLGEESGEDEVYGIVLDTYLTGRATEGAVVTNSEYGWLASAYAPVYTAGGAITAVVGADISMDRILREITLQTVRLLLLTLGIVLVFLAVLLLLIHRQILRPVVRLSRHMEGFSSEDGQLRAFGVPRTGDELQTMAESFNRMAGDIRLYMKNLAAVTADRERIATELNVATQIQASMLPGIFPAFPERSEFDLYASMQPAKEVGGDFYDFFFIDENTLALVMADVSGKGIPAALFMVIAKTLIKNNAQSGKSPREVFETVNNLLCEGNEAGMFVTAFMGYLDIPTGRLDFVNAGHNPPLLRSGGQFGWLTSKVGFVLAGMEDMRYTPHETTLVPGGELFLYTDGVTEAVNRENSLFSDPRLLETANRLVSDGSGGLSLQDFTVSVKREIDRFAEGAEQADDITMLVLRYKGTGAIP
ncbi:MAG: SpoIIE family protein phosphatase [Oscillospiraceae bacterium]|nr:SpoIIE family protein phosphatase [Oscillospiraceae bacterium]